MKQVNSKWRFLNDSIRVTYIYEWTSPYDPIRVTYIYEWTSPYDSLRVTYIHEWTSSYDSFRVTNIYEWTSLYDPIRMTNIYEWTSPYDTNKNSFHERDCWSGDFIEGHLRMTQGILLFSPFYSTSHKDLYSSPYFSGVHVFQPLVFCVVLCQPSFVFFWVFFFWQLHYLSLSVIICHYLSSSVIICHHLSLSVIICHYLSLSVIFLIKVYDYTYCIFKPFLDVKFCLFIFTLKWKENLLVCYYICLNNK
jgi:hypothetical protein